MSEDDSRLARLKRLPPRLRVAHLAALLRCGRLIVCEGRLSYPSARERQRVVGRVAIAKRWSGGGA